MMNLKEKKVGDPIYAHEWNTLVRTIERLLTWDVTNELGTFEQGPHGFALSIARPTIEHFSALIVTAGPSAEADYTDERYWFKRAKPSGSGNPRDLVALGSGEPKFLHSTATNYSEVTNNSHLLRVNDVIEVFVGYGVDGERQFFFWARGGLLFPVTVINDGGAQGTSTTPATYTYEVYALNGLKLGEDVPLDHPRRNGKVILRTSTPKYGWAFYDGTTLRLADAGEVYMPNPC